MGIISKKLRDSAKGRQCTFRIPGVCNHDASTTVLCHAPTRFGGMGTKGHDFLAAFGCSACHAALDNKRIIPAVPVYLYWFQGLCETLAIWVAEGLVKIPVDPETAKRRPGKKHKWPKREFPKGQKLKNRPLSSYERLGSKKRLTKQIYEIDPLLTAQLETEQTGSTTDGRYDDD